ncbi:MAG: phage terminase small subunit P27 family [Acinetobacter sp.]|uniref:phage terminase small subunit P27 family n=1 Tax=Acinetobacter sp. TaxID=472 RepID=UPI000FBC6356|nr:phage terminase small subunit P27 family [Acinetobacter sp.]RUP37059.1 MAG: phage terminase small subunit P27 family [Acinetobacter sp.]
MVAVPEHKKNANTGLILHNSIAEIPSCPAIIGAHGKREWGVVWEYLVEYGIAATIDVSIIIAYCIEVDTYYSSTEQINNEGLSLINDKGAVMANPLISIRNMALKNLIKIASEYGFTPISRQDLKIKQKTASKLDKLFQ